MPKQFVDDIKKPQAMGLKCLCGAEVFIYMSGPGKFDFDCKDPECRAVATVEFHGRRRPETESAPLRLVQ